MRHALPLLLATVAAACPGGGGNGGTSPPPPTVAQVTVTPDQVSVDAGATAQLTATARTAAGALVAGAVVTWGSTNAGVATVSRSGLVTGVTPGSATVTASSGSATASVPVTVRAALVVLPDSVTVTSIGATVAATVTLNGQPTSSAQLGLQGERRWLHDRQVLDAGELAAGRIVAVGAGRAVVRVSAGGLSDSIVVVVAPSQPHVFAAALPGGRTHVGSADTIVLRGYRMHTVTAGQLVTTGAAHTIAGQDSANLRVVVPTLVTAACTGRAPSFTIQYAGVTGQPVGPLTRQRAGEQAIATGGAVRLSSAEAACLRFAPQAGARYLLAYADPRLANQAMTQPEVPWPDSILVTVADQGSQQPSLRLTTPGRLPAGPERPDPALSVAHLDPGTGPLLVPAGCPFANFFLPHCRAAPWALGEEITHYPLGSSRPAGPARIVAIRGNLVLGVFRADSALLAAGAIARADSALAALVQRGVPLLQAMFGLAGPTTTSDESGQLYLMLESSALAAGAAWWPDPPTGHGRWARAFFDPGPTSAFGLAQASQTSALLVIAHEVLHTYQYRYRYQFASPWLNALGTLWGVEGAATAFSIEMVRELAGVPFLGNTLVTAPGPADPRFPLTLYGSTVTDLTSGYLSAASFLRDLAQRLVVAGVTFDVALGEVVVGALEGWHGINEEGLQRGPGLTARMRARLGPSWSPADALLDWTMSQAADDITANARYQNLTVRSAQPSPSTSSIPPHAIIMPGASSSVLRGAGNTGVFELRDDAGGSYHAGATVKGTPSQALEWLLLRIL